MALLEAADRLLSKSVLTFLAIVGLPFFIARAFEPSVDELEPPAIRSHIPFIGHFLRAFREGSDFLANLRKEHRLPVATLPILNSKLYAIWDPILVQSAYCNHKLSFIPFAVDNVRALTGFDEVSHQIVSTTDILPRYFKSIYEGTTARHIHQLNVASLKHVSQQINAIGDDGFVAPNIYLWLRNLMTVATCEALFGPKNPIRSDEIVEDVWTFETGLPELFLQIFPSARREPTLKARKRIQDALAKWATDTKDDEEGVSAYIAYRVAILREYGIEGQRIGDIEVALIHVPTSNSIPTMFWVFMYIFTNRELVLRLRAEVEPVLERGPGDEVTFNIDNLHDKCPLLVSTYREVSRLANKFTCNRRVVEDTTITDGKGRSYLLKKGAAIQMPSGPMHAMQTAWGSDVDDFRPDRFLDTGLTSEEGKLRRAGYTPFGGGAHMCPGRNFAIAEILGFVAAMLTGYNVEPTDGNWDKFQPPAMEKCPMATAVCKPVDEASMFGTRVTRRSGWETVNWRFTSGGLNP